MAADILNKFNIQMYSCFGNLLLVWKLDLIVGLKSQSKSKNSSRSNLNLANLIAAF